MIDSDDDLLAEGTQPVRVRTEQVPLGGQHPKAFRPMPQSKTGNKKAKKDKVPAELVRAIWTPKLTTFLITSYKLTIADTGVLAEGVCLSH